MRKNTSNPRVSAKIKVLVNEGTPQKQAVAMALNMYREGRLGRHGAYTPVKKKGRR